MVDDGSVDKSPDICKAVQQRNPNKARYVRQANGGPATARNNGIELSRGKYVAFVDADDKVSPDFITRMTEIAEETDAQMVICAYWLINGSEKSAFTMTFLKACMLATIAERLRCQS